MKFLVALSCVLWLVDAYPYPTYYYGADVDTLSYGSSDSSRGGMVLSRYYNPYYNPSAVGGGMAAFMFRQPDDTRPQPPSSHYYYPDRRRQVQPEFNYPPPQQNEVFFPQSPEKPTVTEATEIADPTERTEVFSTTPRATIVPEILEPEVDDEEEPVQKPKKRVSKKKQAKRPVDEDDDEDYQPRMPAAAYFPMFFGMGGRSANGGPGGATAIANAYSTGRGGVATSHATAYGVPQPRPDHKLQP